MATAIERAEELFSTWSGRHDMDVGSHQRAPGWFWALSLAYEEQGNLVRAEAYAVMAATAAYLEYWFHHHDVGPE